MITREGIPKHRSAASQGQSEDLGCSGDGILGYPTAAHPGKAHHTQSTCVEGPSEDPALAVSDWPEARTLPLLEDLHAAIPVPRVLATYVVTTPVPRNHTIVIIGIDLGRKKTPKKSAQRVTCRVQGTR